MKISPIFKRGPGQPLKFPDELAVQKIIVDYFQGCQESNEIPNKAGLRIALDMSRENYREYSARYVDTFKNAENWIENAWLGRLATNAPVGAIFYLKNAFKEDYKDRHETDITSGGEPITGFNYIMPHHVDAIDITDQKAIESGNTDSESSNSTTPNDLGT